MSEEADLEIVQLGNGTGWSVFFNHCFLATGYTKQEALASAIFVRRMQRLWNTEVTRKAEEEKIAGAVSAGLVRVWACYACTVTKTGGSLAPVCEKCGRPMEFLTLGEEKDPHKKYAN
jgi:hypothetical protein